MSELSIEELLARAEGKKRLRCENDSRVLTFIEKTQLEHGLLAVPTYVIYWYYRQVYTYPGLFNQNKAKKVTFFRTFKKHFNQYRNKTQRFYLLNPSQLSEIIETVDINGEQVTRITAEVLKKAKDYDKNYGQKKKVQFSRQKGNDEN